MDPKLVEVPDAVVRLNLMSRIPGEPSTPVPAGTPILRIFDEHAGQLLILGAPGAGKTTLLLKLADALLSRAEITATDRIPVYFHLASWSIQQPPLADWLVAELHESYGIEQKVAKGWVDNNQILPLLDGLDEVSGQSRQACVAAINRFRREKGPATMAVCCRKGDYQALASKLELEGAVSVQPLSPAEVSTYLEELGEPMAGVRQLLREDQTLWELLDTPLMIDTVRRAYENQPVEALKLLGGAPERRNHLFKTYVERMFQHRGSNERYPRERTLYWLYWLANQLFQHGMGTDFYIERMQPDWLPPRMQRWVGWSVGMVFGLLVGLVGVLSFGLAAGLSNDFIHPVETIRWSPKQAVENIKQINVQETLVGVLVVVLFVVLNQGLITEDIKKKTLPNEGIRASAQNALLVAAIVVLVGGLVHGLVGGLVVGLLIAPVAGLVYGGGDAVIRHFTLRFLLSVEALRP
jgi:NACHT domain